MKPQLENMTTCLLLATISLLGLLRSIEATDSLSIPVVPPPNIVLVVLDDVGWNDLGYNSPNSPIPTPFIDSLVDRGIQLKQHYVHSVCSPSRAALLTGRYHVNTGLTNVLLPGSPVGIPDGIPTLPQLLHKYGSYQTAMAGKWHLGHAQHKMTPLGRGFQKFTGMYMWDLDSYSKQYFELPWEPALLIDWVKEEQILIESPTRQSAATAAAAKEEEEEEQQHEARNSDNEEEPLPLRPSIKRIITLARNPPQGQGKNAADRTTTTTTTTTAYTSDPFFPSISPSPSSPSTRRSHIRYEHYAEPRHATEAITASALEYISEHVQEQNQRQQQYQHEQEKQQQPLFLYIAFTAAHSPLQPLPRHVQHPACQALAHSWRRDFCGMVVGLDEAMSNITAHIEEQLGSNTIMVVLSDNGGSPWFGGMNAPLRGSKGTPMEGGVRVPAFIVDFSHDQHYLGGIKSPTSEDSSVSTTTNGDVTDADIKTGGGRVFYNLMHVSDWLPTLLSYANIPYRTAVRANKTHEETGENMILLPRLDGIDFSQALRSAMPASRAPSLLRSHSPSLEGSFDACEELKQDFLYYQSSKNSNDHCYHQQQQQEQGGDGGSSSGSSSGSSGSSSSTVPRCGLLLEMFSPEESVFKAESVAYRLGDYKLIKGAVRDSNYYEEFSTSTSTSTAKYSNRLTWRHVDDDWASGFSSKRSTGSSTTTTADLSRVAIRWTRWLFTYMTESTVCWMEYVFGKARSDTLHIIMVHKWLHTLFAYLDQLVALAHSEYVSPLLLPVPVVPRTDPTATATAKTTTSEPPAAPPVAASATGVPIRLYNIAKDPCETKNLMHVLNTVDNHAASGCSALLSAGGNPQQQHGQQQGTEVQQDVDECAEHIRSVLEAIELELAHIEEARPPPLTTLGLQTQAEVWAEKHLTNNDITPEEGITKETSASMNAASPSESYHSANNVEGEAINNPLHAEDKNIAAMSSTAQQQLMQHLPCAMNPAIPLTSNNPCRFTHSWVLDDEDPLKAPGLITADEYIHRKLMKFLLQLGVSVCICTGMLIIFLRWMRVSMLYDE